MTDWPNNSDSLRAGTEQCLCYHAKKLEPPIRELVEISKTLTPHHIIQPLVAIFILRDGLVAPT